MVEQSAVNRSVAGSSPAFGAIFRMSEIAHIVSGGGWKSTRKENIKVKTWVTLYAGIGFGFVSMMGQGSIWSYCWIPAVISFAASVVLFICEKPRKVEFPQGRVGQDPRNLYSCRFRS